MDAQAGADADRVAVERIRSWARVAIPAVWLSLGLTVIDSGAATRLVAVGLALSWGATLWFGLRKRWLRWLESVAVAGAFVLFGVAAMGLFAITVAGAGMSSSLRHGLVRAGATIAAIVLGLYLIEPLYVFYPIFPLVPVFPGVAMFAIGRALRVSILAQDRAQRLAAELSESKRRLELSLDAVSELATARERARIARELHDSLGHCLTNAHVHLELARRANAVAHEVGSSEADESEVADALAQARAANRRGLEELRRCVAVMREPSEASSLTQVMRDFIDNATAPTLDVRFVVLGRERKLAGEREFVLFRALQESLTNAAKHAGTCAVDVSLTYLETGAARLVVADDGCGPGADDGGGYGLIGLRERVEAVGGRLRAELRPEGGFCVVVELEAQP